MSNRQFLEKCENLRMEILAIKDYDNAAIETVIMKLLRLKSNDSIEIEYNRSKFWQLVTNDINIGKQAPEELVSTLVHQVDLLAERSWKKNIGFADFIDKIANKLSCLGIFNALFIYSLSLDANFFSKCLVVTFLFLSLLLIHTVIVETFSLFNKKSFSFIGFVICLIVVAIALTSYSVIKYPEFLHTVLFVCLLFFYGRMIIFIFVSIQVRNYEFLNRKSIIANVYSTLANFWVLKELLLIVISFTLTYYSQPFLFNMITNCLPRI